jgi:hypothetical protein
MWRTVDPLAQGICPECSHPWGAGYNEAPEDACQAADAVAVECQAALLEAVFCLPCGTMAVWLDNG